MNLPVRTDRIVVVLLVVEVFWHTLHGGVVSALLSPRVDPVVGDGSVDDEGGRGSLGSARGPLATRTYSVLWVLRRANL